MNMRNYFTIGLLLFAVIACSSGGKKKYERVEPTANERYSIVYNGGKCGVYDNNADSLVTSFKYDALQYGRCAEYEDVKFTVWSCVVDGYNGLLSIGSGSNELVEILMPKKD